MFLFKDSLTKPLKSQLTNTSSDCMELSWTQPKLAAGESIARYEVVLIFHNFNKIFNIFQSCILNF